MKSVTLAMLTMILSAGSTGYSSDALNPDSATHKPVSSIRPVLNGDTIPFHTFAMSPNRQLWLCCSSRNNNTDGRLLVFDVFGNFVRSSELPFVATAIGFSNELSDPAIFVAGSGRIAKLKMDGSLAQMLDAPNIGNREEVKAALREDARKQAAELLSGTEKQKERVKIQMSQMESAPDGETPEQESRRFRRLKLLKQQEKQIQLTIDSVSSGEAGVNDGSLSYLERATAIAVTQQYVFVALPTVPGFGYDVWRMDHALANPKKVIERGSGCCGQFDIQTNGTQLAIAENSNFQVAYYDLDGKPIQKFGRRSAVDADGFGSCCNPMNICCEGDEVLTAESSIGHIKRFNKAGELIAYIGRIPIGGGCKHVALAHDKVTDRYFMFNDDRKSISVMVPKEQASDESEDERATRIAMAGLGKKLIGKWQATPTELTDNPLADFLVRKFGRLNFGEKGDLSQSSLSDNLSIPTDVLVKLAKLSGSDEAAKMLAKPSEQSRWSAMEQQNEVLKIVFYEDGVTSFEGSVQFLDNDSMNVTYFYGTAGSIARIRYSRTGQ
ncbi:MAG: hypothetical protein ABL921_20915 [Pirellula sp.]